MSAPMKLNMTSKDLLCVENLQNDSKMDQMLKFRKSDKSKLNRNDGRPNICKVEPSSVLSNVKQFLPLMKEANRKLDNVPTDDIDIECINEAQDQVIEMNLALFEQSDDEDTDSSDESSDDDITYGEVTEENIKLPNQKNRKPHIQEIDTKGQNPG